MKKTRIDLTGRKFGRLTVEKYAFTKNTLAYWQCICECGNITFVRAGDLVSGNTKSCGCAKKNSHTKHGLINSRIYHIWAGIKRRCYNTKNPSYKYYGMRGIQMDNIWKNNFLSFYNWALNNGYKENLTIDRIDSNGNYEPSNCRWATREEQSCNTRRNRYITYNNETHCIAEWAKIYNLKEYTIRYRLNNNWTIEEALTTKSKRNRRI